MLTHRYVANLSPIANGTGGARTTNEYFDAVGFVTQIEDDLGHDTFYVPDTYHRLDQVKDHNNVVKLDYAHDAANNVIEVKDGLGEITDLDYDALERLTAATNPNLDTIRSVLDGNNQAVASIDGLSNVSQSIFNALGQNTFTVDANWGLVQQEFDALGNRLSLTDPVGNTTRFVYNGNRQMIKEIRRADLDV
jgi:YD repeat-containing protein